MVKHIWYSGVPDCSKKIIIFIHLVISAQIEVKIHTFTYHDMSVLHHCIDVTDNIWKRFSQGIVFLLYFGNSNGMIT